MDRPLEQARYMNYKVQMDDRVQNTNNSRMTEYNLS
jgi:hypothetical protein